MVASRIAVVVAGPSTGARARLAVGVGVGIGTEAGAVAGAGVELLQEETEEVFPKPAESHVAVTPEKWPPSERPLRSFPGDTPFRVSVPFDESPPTLAGPPPAQPSSSPSSPSSSSWSGPTPPSSTSTPDVFPPSRQALASLPPGPSSARRTLPVVSLAPPPALLLLPMPEQGSRGSPRRWRLDGGLRPSL